MSNLLFKMKPNYRAIIEDCVERGINRGWSRAHKHIPEPSEEHIKGELENCIMAELYDYFVFDLE